MTSWKLSIDNFHLSASKTLSLAKSLKQTWPISHQFDVKLIGSYMLGQYSYISTRRFKNIKETSGIPVKRATGLYATCFIFRTCFGFKLGNQITTISFRYAWNVCLTIQSHKERYNILLLFALVLFSGRISHRITIFSWVCLFMSSKAPYNLVLVVLFYYLDNNTIIK